MSGRPEFVGRRKELSELRTCMSEACGHNGAVVLIRGELGIGKTRLMEEFAEPLREEGAVVVSGRWYESAAALYAGLRESLLLLLQQTAVSGALDRSSPFLPEIARLGAEFAAVLNLEPGGSAGAPGDEPYRLWRGAALVLQAAAVAGPTVILLDDLQWADPGSLSCLSFLGQGVRTSRTLIVGTYREEEVPADHPLHKTIAELTQARTLRTIRLAGLSKEDVGTLAVAIAKEDVASEFIDALHQQAQGNPLFVEEVMLHIVDDRRAIIEAPIAPADSRRPRAFESSWVAASRP